MKSGELSRSEGIEARKLLNLGGGLELHIGVSCLFTSTTCVRDGSLKQTSIIITERSNTQIRVYHYMAFNCIFQELQSPW